MAQTTITKTIDQGDSITIQATPNENYSFGGWSFDNNTTINTNPYTYTPNSSDDIEAIFNITDPLVVVCTDKTDAVGRYLYLVNKENQVKYWGLNYGTNTYTGNDPGWELDNIITFYGDTYYPRGNKPTVDSKVGANFIISIDAHSLVNVEYLPDTAFFRQLALTSITLPLYLREVGDGQYCTTGTTYRGVFEECTSLSTVNWGNDTTTVGKISWIKKIWNYAFYKCNLSSITIPTYNLDSTDPNSNDLELCDYCFGSNNLTSINFTNIYNIGRVRYIREGAFYNNINLTTFNIPNYGSILQGIGNNPFFACKRLATFTEINSSARFRKLGNNILDHTYAKLISGGCNMTIPTEIINPVFTIGAYAFRGMCQTSLKSFTLPDTVKVIESSAFSDNPYLQQFLTTSNSELTTMQQLCFYGDTRLEKVELYSISQFGANASSNTAFRIFYGCTKLGLEIYIHTLTVPTLYTPTLETFPEYNTSLNQWTWTVYVEPGMLSSYASTSSVQYDWAYWYSQGRIKTRISVNSDVNPNNSGTVSGAGDVDVSSTSGTNTTLTATNNRGYSFNNWTKNGVSMSSSNPYTFKVSDVSGGSFGTYIANFNTLQSYTISTSVNDNTYGSASGGGTYYSGESCTLTATPNTGYEFVNWTENGTTVSSNSTYTFTVSGNKTVVANFQSSVPKYAVNLAKESGDSDNPTFYINGVATNSGSFEEGEEITISVVPSAQFDVYKWYNQSNTIVISEWENYYDKTVDGYIQDSKSFKYTVKTSNPTIYYKSWPNNSTPIIYTRYDQYFDSQYMPLPGFDCYNSSNVKIGEILANPSTGDQGYFTPSGDYTKDDVYKLVAHSAMIDGYDSPCDLNYINYIDFYSFKNLYQIEGIQYSTYISAETIHLPSSCKVLKNLTFTSYTYGDEFGNQFEQKIKEINLGNIQQLDGVEFNSLTLGDITATDPYDETMLVWNGIGGLCFESLQTSINNSGITGSNLSYLRFPSATTSIPGCSSNTSLTSVYINPNFTGTTLNNNQFSSCSSLTSITLPDSLRTIPNSCFSWCSGLTEFKHKYIQTIESYAFRYCSNLSKLVLPSIKTIQSYALQTNGLRVLKFGNYRNSNYGIVWNGSLGIDNNAFGSMGTNITDIYINTCDGPTTTINSSTLSTAISSTKPNSTFTVHVDEDDIYDESYWDNIKAIPAARKEYDVIGMYNSEF